VDRKSVETSFGPTSRSASDAAPRRYFKEHLGAAEADVKLQEEVRLAENHRDAIAPAPREGKSDRSKSLNMPAEDQASRFCFRQIATKPNRCHLRFSIGAKLEADIVGKHIERGSAVDQRRHLHATITRLKGDRRERQSTGRAQKRL
jgi:hypothetical protein